MSNPCLGSPQVNSDLRERLDGSDCRLAVRRGKWRGEECCDGGRGVRGAAHGHIAMFEVGRLKIRAERSEHDLRAALGLEKYAPVSIDPGHADDVAVSGG